MIAGPPKGLILAAHLFFNKGEVMSDVKQVFEVHPAIFPPRAACSSDFLPIYNRFSGISN